MMPESGAAPPARPDEPGEGYDTVIVGAGQAGLSVGYHLGRLGQSFVILDRNQRIGDNWRERYDSLRLFSPAKYDALPGLPFPAPRYAFPSGRQVADYLESYATRMRLPVLAGTGVDSLEAGAGGGFVIHAGERRIAAAHVVVATGIHQQPVVPAFADGLDPRIRQLHSSEYRNPSQLLTGDVLVVGVGHSGADIALEVARAHQTWLSGPVHGQVPLDIEARLARPVWWLLWFAAKHVLTVRTPLGRGSQSGASRGGPLVRVRLPDLAAAGVRHVAARTIGVRDGLPMLADDRALNVTNVIWCTGFRHDFSWIRLPVIGGQGWPLHERGVCTSVPGLYFTGLPFQYSFASVLIGGVGRDARYIARQIAACPPVATPRVFTV